jgi:pyruvate dehydrogenase E1 component beta subunit
VTLVAFSRMVGAALEAAKQLEKEGISAEVINLRCVRACVRVSVRVRVC